MTTEGDSLLPVVLQMEDLSDEEEQLPALYPGNDNTDYRKHVLLLVNKEGYEPYVRHNCAPDHHF